MPPPVALSISGADAKLALADLRYLFEGPQVDPLAGVFEGRSGFDLLLEQLKREKLPSDRLRLTIVAPAGQVDAQAQTMVRPALAGHVDNMLGTLDCDRRLQLREMRQSLRVGGLFLAVCLILSALVDQLSVLPAFVQTLLRESLLIAGWVGLWHPLDLLLYAWWPLRYRRMVLTYVRGAEVKLVAA